MSTHMTNFEMQYLNNQAFDHPGSYVFFAHHTLSGYSIYSQNCVTSNMTKFESHEQNHSISDLYVVDSVFRIIAPF